MKGPAILSREESEALGRRIAELAGVPSVVSIRSTASATTRFALGEAHVATETASVEASLSLAVGTRRSEVSSNRLDETGLKTLVADAKAAAQEHRSPSALELLGPQTYPEGPPMFFDSSVSAMAAEAQAAVFRAAIDATELAGLIGAGDVSLRTSSNAILNSAGLILYERSSYGEFSLTARTTDGTGSGWAWSGYEDWGRVKVEDVIARAVDLGRRSKTPVAVEPGRYTVILEPSAVAALLQPILQYQLLSARQADRGGTVFSKEPTGNKIGLQMMDRRLGLVSSPWDREQPGSTIGPGLRPVRGAVAWFEHGVLENLAYDPEYARRKGKEPVIASSGLRLEAEGPATTLEEMIASTDRGIWVNRLSHVDLMNERTLLLSGTTRDGTFLIEGGKITKSIKNLRFTDSPFFVFNKLVAFGDPVRASRVIVAPRLKVRDFDFTSLTEAV